MLKSEFYCKVSGCKVSGKLRLHINMELHLEYNINLIEHKKDGGNFFQAQLSIFFVWDQKELKEDLQEKLLDIKFSSKRFYKKLASFDEDSFSTGNLAGAAKSKEVYKEILQLHHDMYLSIAKVKKKLSMK